MCGIFAYAGKSSNAGKIIFDGLKTLEYRGYDSWGIAVQKENIIHIQKQTGKISDAKLSLPSTSLGIGHTRWATHGGVTVDNAHPHLDCTKQIAVLHNGIVENFQTLKNKLLKKGHVFTSETDTEVIAHLLEEELNISRGGKTFVEAMKNTFSQLHGLNAIVALNATSQEIVAAKNGSPLLVGLTKDGYFLASDATGIINHTKQVIFLEDNQMVSLSSTGLHLSSLPDGKEIIPTIHTLDWDFEEAQKGDYPHFFLKEIHEQPKVIENIALTYQSQTKQLANLIENAFGTFILGCGTASYAALAGVYLFSSIAKKHINFTIGSEFNYLEDYITPKTLVIPISQSGETIDVVEPVQKAKIKGAKIAALVNVLGSTIYRQADFKIVLGAGQEKAVVATKSFMAMFSVIFLTAYTLAKKQKTAKLLLQKASNNIKHILKRPTNTTN